MAAVDLRQVMAAVLTFSMFVMLANMIKRDHIDPYLGPLKGTPIVVRYSVLKVSKPGMVKLSEINYGPWKKDHSMNPSRPCWNIPMLKGNEPSNGYILLSLTHGPEFHASQVANAVAVARHLRATLAVPDIRGSKLGEIRNFGEIYDLDKFITSLDGIVKVDKSPPAELSNERPTIVRVPDRVSKNYIDSKIRPIFQSKRNLKIVTIFNSSQTENQQPNPYQCLAMSKSLTLQPELQNLVGSMVGTLHGMSLKTGGRFISVDLRAEMLEKQNCQGTDSERKQCYNAQEIGEFLNRIGFHKETSIYITQTGWHANLNPLRSVFPNTFTKDAIIPADENAKFRGYEKFIDYYMCVQGDVFVPAYPGRFYEGVVGERIALGKTQVLLPTKKTSTSAADYVSPYIAKRDHYVHSCFC